MLSIFVELFFGARERIEQAQLCLGRKQRLMIVRDMKIDQIVAKTFQNRQCGWRTIDELARAASSRKAAFDDEIVLAWFDSRLDKLRIDVLQIVSSPKGFHGAKLGPGADERFIGALAKQKLERTNDDRFACAGFSGDGNEAGPKLPL